MSSISPTGRRPVLVVEDCDEDYETVCEALRRSGRSTAVRRTMTGGEGLSALRGEGADAIRPALVLMDLNTPGVSGREALEEIKRDPALRQLPVVVFSTSANPRDLGGCYAAGANAYHVKPLAYADHLRVLEGVFSYWLDRVLVPDLPGTAR